MARYTSDWFSSHVSKLSQFISRYENFPCKILEIGSYEGRSSNWFVENYCKHSESQLTCIDTFLGSWEHNQQQKDGLYNRFVENTANNSKKIRVFCKGSEFVLPTLLELGEKFDFIYIDGDHVFDAVMCDAIYAHKLIKTEGIIVFDDYEWFLNQAPAHRIPHHAINAFLEMHKADYDLLEKAWQVTVKRRHT